METPEPPSSFTENISYFDRGLEQAFTWFSDNLGTFLFILFIGLITILVARNVNRLMDSYFKRANSRLHVDTTSFRMFRHIVVALIYFMGIVVVVFSIPGLRSLSVALFTGAGIAGIVIGLAAQSTLSNIVAGLSLAIFQPFRVGDRLNIMNEYGKVTDLNLRHTVIITWDNRRLIIPNSIISNEAIINWTIEDPAVIWPIDIGISYDADIDQARGIMIEEARKHPNVMPPQEVKYNVVKPSLIRSETIRMGLFDSPVLHPVDPDFRERGEVKVSVVELGESSVNLRMNVWFKDRSVAYSSGCEIMEAIKKRFDKEGVEIPYPHRTIVYKNSPGKEKKVAEKLSGAEGDKIRCVVKAD
ncbi:mechanosensitive ion channel family protein [Methanosarcina sp. MSH10X1]|uniref:mechanosensitive ion channel family protein n=1 Tax=Methanosarcina sp. MSH10X1 TaxID=2507075 RepID=UPI000FFCBFF5|nr:mechanosensitive ion channel family protein [Methanosarcina sp. MSH10X1]RXA17444.1 mechanosensitive ion channel family protein [Methanosarcina sp. MSH10X1]